MFDPLPMVFDSPEKTKQMIEILKDRGVKFGVDTSSLSHQERVVLIIEVQSQLQARENPH